MKLPLKIRITSSLKASLKFGTLAALLGAAVGSVLTVSSQNTEFFHSVLLGMSIVGVAGAFAGAIRGFFRPVRPTPFIVAKTAKPLELPQLQPVSVEQPGPLEAEIIYTAPNFNDLVAKNSLICPTTLTRH